VQYLSIAEVAVAAVAYNHYLAIPLVLASIAALLLDYFSVHWWMVSMGSFGLGGAITLGTCILREERESRPIYYQYDNTHLQGAEGMLYKVGSVVQRLSMVRVNGELWNAVSMSGEEIEAGEKVEVLRLDGLTLYLIGYRRTRLNLPRRSKIRLQFGSSIVIMTIIRSVTPVPL
jgi:membrane protein implicated in regulation of membrane protease activity